MIIVFYCYFCVFLLSCHCQSYLDRKDVTSTRLCTPNPIVKCMTVPNGTPITLKCHRDKTKWEFKSCKKNLHTLACDDNGHWENLHETRGKMHIIAASKRDNGMYRCLHNKKVLRTFQVEVIQPSYIGEGPRVALKTSNLTGPINMEFMMQCNVTSDVPPMITWFKSCYGNKCDLRYNQICYCHISTTNYSSYNSGSTHISKYIIFNARDVDSGIYTCFAVNEFGKDYQNVTIVVPSQKNQESFSLLFLIPLVLILIPMAIWLCYYRKKKKAVIEIEQQKRPLRSALRIK